MNEPLRPKAGGRLWMKHRRSLREVTTWMYGSKGSVRPSKSMTDILKKLSRKELRSLTPGIWVAWGKSNWDSPDKQDFAFWEAQVMAHPVRSAQNVLVLLNGLPHAVHKNRLYKVMPVIDVEEMHTEYDYNS